MSRGDPQVQARRVVVVETRVRAKDSEEAGRFRAYTLAAARDAIQRGESPYLEHLFLPEVLAAPVDDSDPALRSVGIHCHLSWIDRADAVVIYEDHGISSGMRYAIDRAIAIGVDVEYRKLYG